MRVWEFEDKKEMPSDLVREQDFILRVRRMQRSGLPCLAVNFILTAIDALAKDSKLLEETQKKLRSFASSSNGAYYEMSNGDVFLVWENPGEAKLITNRAIDAAMPEYRANTNVFYLIYRMPESYALLRERTNSYVEEVRSRVQSSLGPEKVDESSGRLTAKNVDQIERLLVEADIRRYGRSQPIYRDSKGVWTAQAEEYFVSFEELRRENFPKLSVMQTEPLFLAICALLDQKLLGALTASYATIAGKVLNLNLSIASIMGSLFAQFVRCVPRDQRRLIGFELNCVDLLQDIAVTLGAVDVLRSEGFRIFIDGVSPNIVPFVNLERFQVDAIKINVSKDLFPQFIDPAVRKGLERLTPNKIVFYRCDTENALALGREMGVSLFQGWFIDDLSSKKK